MLDKIIQKIKDLIPKKKVVEEKKVESTNPKASTPPSSDEEAKKKKKAKIIKIVAGVVVLYVAIDEFFLKKEAPPEPEKVQVPERKKTERKPKKSLLVNIKEEAPSREVSSVPATPEPTSPPIVESPAEAPQEQPKTTEAQQSTPEPTIPTPEETPAEQLSVSETTTQEAPESLPEATTEESVSQVIPSPTEEVAKEMEKVAEQVGPIPEEEIKPAEKVQLPDYTSKGRGLVYNCSGKHWACIDKSGYLNCREHMQWSQENNKSPECVVKNVYNSEEDCAVVQSHYVNTNEPTTFCK